jgi:hypothetical protein
MTWEQKFDALKALAGEHSGTGLGRLGGQWYMRVPGVEAAERGMLSAGGGHATTPEKAVENQWEMLTSATAVKVGGDADGAKYYRWNGYMWRECGAPK